MRIIFSKTWHQYRVPNREDYNNHYEKDTLENGLPNKNTGLGDSKIIIDPSTKTISQTGEGYAPDTIAPDAEYYVNTIVGTTTSKKLGASKD